MLSRPAKPPAQRVAFTASRGDGNATLPVARAGQIDWRPINFAGANDEMEGPATRAILRQQPRPGQPRAIARSCEQANRAIYVSEQASPRSPVSAHIERARPRPQAAAALWSRDEKNLWRMGAEGTKRP